jgi:LuxR family maltose regulon positive regulatory protein
MTSDRLVAPLLTVKQVVPPARDGLVARDRLIRRLSSGARLVLVVAPAGWGKTALLSGWAASLAAESRVAWVSLDEGDNDPLRFWRYLINSVHAASDAIGPAPLDALAAPGLGPLDLAVPLLLNELAATTIPHALVLDDVHLISDREVGEQLEYFVSYQPSSLRLVLASRQDPPLPVARLRARGELTELRADELRFTEAESAAMLAAVTGAKVDPVVAAEAWARTEGWAAGLQLAGLALRGQRDDRGVELSTSDDRHLLDYFEAEVLPALTAEERHLLVNTARLERLSGPLCDAALNRAGSALLLERLDRASLFVVALDRRREWYRCHQLFREALLREAALLSPSAEQEADAVLTRAAGWFADHDLRDEAVRCLLRAGQDDSAADLLMSSERWFFDHGLAASYLALGDGLPDEFVTPQLALTLAYAAEACGRRERMGHWLDVCEARLTDQTSIRGWRSARAAAVMMRGLVGIPEADSARAVELTGHAVELERAAGNPDPWTALLAYGAALERDGRFADGADVLAGCWRARAATDWSAGVVLQLAGLLGLCLVESGREQDLARLLAEVRPLAEQAERDWDSAALPLVALLRVVEAIRLYRAGQAPAAREHLAGFSTAGASLIRASTLVLGLVVLGDAELAGGDRSAARSALSRARDVVHEESVPAYVVARLDQAEARIGRRAVQAANRAGQFVEELTERELAILRTLPGSATQREIGAAMYLSLNTIKAYNKVIYRKLGVGSRQEAVAVARQLGLI